MSRTYRAITFRWGESVRSGQGRRWDPPLKNFARTKGVSLKHWYRRDHKKWFKPDRNWKHPGERSYRAKCKDAAVKGREYPRIRKGYEYDFV